MARVLGSCPIKVQLLFLPLSNVSPPKLLGSKVVQREKGKVKGVPYLEGLRPTHLHTAAWVLPLSSKSRITPPLNHLWDFGVLPFW